jgi:hypothetical protein
VVDYSAGSNRSEGFEYARQGGSQGWKNAGYCCTGDNGRSDGSEALETHNKGKPGQRHSHADRAGTLLTNMLLICGCPTGGVLSSKSPRTCHRLTLFLARIPQYQVRR